METTTETGTTTVHVIAYRSTSPTVPLAGAVWGYTREEAERKAAERIGPYAGMRTHRRAVDIARSQFHPDQSDERTITEWLGYHEDLFELTCRFCLTGEFAAWYPVDERQGIIGLELDGDGHVVYEYDGVTQSGESGSDNGWTCRNCGAVAGENCGGGSLEWLLGLDEPPAASGPGHGVSPAYAIAWDYEPDNPNTHAWECEGRPFATAEQAITAAEVHAADEEDGPGPDVGFVVVSLPASVLGNAVSTEPPPLVGSFDRSAIAEELDHYERAGHEDAETLAALRARLASLTDEDVRQLGFTAGDALMDDLHQSPMRYVLDALEGLDR